MIELRKNYIYNFQFSETDDATEAIAERYAKKAGCICMVLRKGINYHIISLGQGYYVEFLDGVEFIAYERELTELSR